MVLAIAKALSLAALLMTLNGGEMPKEGLPSPVINPQRAQIVDVKPRRLILADELGCVEGGNCVGILPKHHLQKSLFSVLLLVAM